MVLSDIDWFEWNGERCTLAKYGMHVLSQPSIVGPVERIESVSVPGKSGSLTILEGDDVFDNIALSCSCVIDDPNFQPNDSTMTRIMAITGWLRGRGEVKFANRPGGFYKGRIANQISFDKAVQGNPHRLFSVQFQCEPFFYFDTGKTSTTYSAAVNTITNPGNIPSAPLITLNKGSAATGTIMCGGSTMYITFAETGQETLSSITLDCEAKVAYTGNGTAASPYRLRGTRVQGDWFTIPAGQTHFDLSGIASAVVTPRWRSI